MSIIAHALKKEGLKIQGDALPKEQRTVKVFQRLIAAMRAAEAQVEDSLRTSERELNESLHENLVLQERVRVLEKQVIEFRLKEKASEIESLTVADKTKLLSVMANGD